MSLPNLFPEGIIAIAQDDPQRSLIKLVALMRELVVGGTSGSSLVSAASSSGSQSSLIVKSSPGTLFTITAFNTSGSDRYLQLFDAASVPADTTVPLISLLIPSATTGAYDFGFKGLPFATGIVAVTSSAAATKTLAGSALFLASYV